MKLIVGLGNPGEKYRNNRHNAGYMAVDELQNRKLPKETIVKKTNVLMNSSGDIVKKYCSQYHINAPDLWIIHDDLDIRLGEHKIQKGKGPKLHYGVASIENELNETDFWRVRIGVDNREPDNRTPGEEYVLHDFTSEEKEMLAKVISAVCSNLTTRS